MDEVLEECIACTYSGVDEQMYAAHGCPACTCVTSIELEPLVLPKVEKTTLPFPIEMKTKEDHFQDWVKKATGDIGIVPGYSQGLIGERSSFDYAMNLRQQLIENTFVALGERDKRITELEEQVLEQDALLGNPRVSVDLRMHHLKEQVKKLENDMNLMHFDHRIVVDNMNSSYEALKNEYDQAVKLIQDAMAKINTTADKGLTKINRQMKLLMDVILYYADVNNWEEDMEGHMSYRNKIKDDSSNEAGMFRWVRQIGGRRARVAHKEFCQIEQEYQDELKKDS